MEEAYARRALLLHLGSVLQILSRLEQQKPDNLSIEALLATNGMLADVPLVEYVVQDMTVREFEARALRSFCLWPQLLLEDPLDYGALALPVRKHLFAGNDTGWKAYASTLREAAPGFGIAGSYTAEPHEAESDFADERDDADAEAGDIPVEPGADDDDGRLRERAAASVESAAPGAARIRRESYE
ncbi:hypothetical protein [Burkholderia oklahomensis]|uniref:Uncharacterized protein n=1 Tax=Burkholderia oklahomensis TaxID=342113 RepID=A0AAI8FQ27_9BURK|nr:hypothetical protein [Burkholderia oklahomensis]AIO68442.1 hypothetical protein DM82_3285 [Burkholderia oklahomensis]AJX31175.1 hypothetical protein BG90_1482 [Burkholderia oklahomensis C6786]AOI44004.1 hypothetical protein WG70_31665 [Burkholderia oklahomensis EO147]AOI47872.1 hypothetical protein WI23_18205 [Burkholderia oklahomensis C6786]KUY55602.1 hypothetical protein WG70_12310 [Burkholderia oklahomensis EO147]